MSTSTARATSNPACSKPRLRPPAPQKRSSAMGRSNPRTHSRHSSTVGASGCRASRKCGVRSSFTPYPACWRLIGIHRRRLTNYNGVISLKVSLASDHLSQSPGGGCGTHRGSASLEPGDRLPSVQEVAGSLPINHPTPPPKAHRRTRARIARSRRPGWFTFVVRSFSGPSHPGFAALRGSLEIWITKAKAQASTQRPDRGARPKDASHLRRIQHCVRQPSSRRDSSGATGRTSARRLLASPSPPGGSAPSWGSA